MFPIAEVESSSGPLRRSYISNPSTTAPPRPSLIAVDGRGFEVLPLPPPRPPASHAADGAHVEPRAVPSPNDQPVRRVMGPLKDTRIARMGQSRVPPAPPTTREKPAETSPAAKPILAHLPVIPQRFTADAGLSAGASARRAAVPAPAFGTRAFLLGPDDGAAPPANEEGSTAAPSASADAPPPLPPAARANGTGAAVIDDMAAALLRPLLKQWLEDNMQRMVGRALVIEVGESARPDKA